MYDVLIKNGLMVDGSGKPGYPGSVAVAGGKIAAVGQVSGGARRTARAEEVGDDMGEIDAKVEGPEAKIAFNAKYLADVLAMLGKGEVALETTGPSSPGLLRPAGKSDFLHVVMPMFVQW